MTWWLTKIGDSITLDRSYTNRAEGMSISFEAHLLGKHVEFDQHSASPTIKNLRTQLIDPQKRAAG